MPNGKKSALKGCKLSGIDFEHISKMLLSFSFDNCHISYCNFMGLKITNTRFLNSEIKECDFVKTDLSGSNFSSSNLSGSTFNDCDLSRVDFRETHGYQFNPRNNKLKKAKFSVPAVLALLSEFDIEIG
jgi:fluoroquinolone resistance protein